MVEIARNVSGVKKVVNLVKIKGQDGAPIEKSETSSDAAAPAQAAIEDHG